jgi:hypothetical protein
MLLTRPRHDASDITVELTPRETAVAPVSASGQALAFLRFLLTDQLEATPASELVEWRWRRA